MRFYHYRCHFYHYFVIAPNETMAVHLVLERMVKELSDREIDEAERAMIYRELELISDHPVDETIVIDIDTA